MKRVKAAVWMLLPLLGLAFCWFYINIAWRDVVYTDYMRITYNYLPDVLDPDKFFVKDILTRIPLNYLERFINVTFFGFNTKLDMFLCAFGLTASGWVLCRYCLKEKISFLCYAVILLLLFSLNKWEMLINGTGWIHFAAFVCFYYHYMVADRYLLKKEAKPHDALRLKILPFAVVLLVAGPYCAIYCLVLIMLYGLVFLMERREKGVWNREYIVFIICTLIPLILYIISNHFVDEPLRNVCTEPTLTYFFKDPVLFVKFFIKSFGSMVMGEEVCVLLGLTGTQMALLGCVVICGYLLGLYVYWRAELYKVSWFPLILMVSGGLNHLLILYSRWRFLKDTYGMSSRYALQFQVGIFGILLTLALAFKQKDTMKRLEKAAVAVLAALFCAVLLRGNYLTTHWELLKAPGRQAYADGLIDLAYRLDEVTDDELKPFQYSYLYKTREALEILREQEWNVFRPDYER